MAILRGGKRIGGMDIRIGIARTFYEYPSNLGSNKKQVIVATIGRFQSYVNEAEGFGKPGKYYIYADFPRGH